MKTDADCYLAYDAICGSGQIGDLHVATQSGPDAFTKLFPVKLRSLTSLPASVKKPLDQDADELTVVAALEQAGRPVEDAGEPSWGVLAHLAKETRFVHSWRRLHFMTHVWNVPTGDYFDRGPAVRRQTPLRPLPGKLGMPPGKAAARSPRLVTV